MRELSLLERRNVARYRTNKSQWMFILRNGHCKETYDMMGIPATLDEYDEYIKTHPILQQHLPKSETEVF